jgi:ketosteroid isomerase-like protein
VERELDPKLEFGLDGRMKTKLGLTVCVVLVSLTFAGTALSAGSKGGDEQAVRDADAQWSAAAAAKDLDKTVSFYADDAIVLPPNEAAVTTKDGIRNLWKGLIDSVSSINWTATRVEMAKSGEMACISGTYELTMNDGTKDRGKYCEVWEKKGGTWKCGTDIWNSDLPAAPAASPAPGSAEKE